MTLVSCYINNQEIPTSEKTSPSHFFNALAKQKTTSSATVKKIKTKRYRFIYRNKLIKNILAMSLLFKNTYAKELNTFGLIEAKGPPNDIKIYGQGNNCHLSLYHTDKMQKIINENSFDYQYCKTSSLYDLIKIPINDELYICGIESINNNLGIFCHQINFELICENIISKKYLAQDFQNITLNYNQTSFELFLNFIF